MGQVRQLAQRQGIKSMPHVKYRGKNTNKRATTAHTYTETLIYHTHTHIEAHTVTNKLRCWQICTVRYIMNNVVVVVAALVVISVVVVVVVGS